MKTQICLSFRTPEGFVDALPFFLGPTISSALFTGLFNIGPFLLNQLHLGASQKAVTIVMRLMLTSVG